MPDAEPVQPIGWLIRARIGGTLRYERYELPLPLLLPLDEYDRDLLDVEYE